jgi:hypothetical protein
MRRVNIAERIDQTKLESWVCCVEFLMRKSNWTPSIVPRGHEATASEYPNGGDVTVVENWRPATFTMRRLRAMDDRWLISFTT